MIKKKFLKNNLIYLEDSLSKVIETLNISEEKICIVLNKRKKVCGLITDGDLRRILIKERNFRKKVSKFVKKKFIFFRDQDNLVNSKILEKFEKNSGINHIPVLDKKNFLVGIYSRKNVFKQNSLENIIFILAGGLGKRLHTLTDFYPKPMINVGERPLLESILYSLKSSGFRNIYISVNYLQNKIKDYFKDGKNLNLNINYISEKKRLGTAGPLYFIKSKKSRKPILILNGDVYTNLKIENLLDFHIREKNDITVCFHSHNIKVPYGVLNFKKNSKTLINEKPNFEYLVNSGIYVLNPNLLKFIPHNKYYDMNEYLNLLKKKKKKIGFFNIHENLYDIGDYDKLMEARRLF